MKEQSLFWLRVAMLIFYLGGFTAGFAQYSPPAGYPGTTAMYKDSTAFFSWASTCTIERGYIDISDTTFLFNGSNKAAYGSYLFASGPADELVVSLGDQGSAILGFSVPIIDHIGPDFAVFENSFSDAFLELAFVEASSDGIHFVRFPAISLTETLSQVSTFDTLDARKVHNFAGKFRHGFGTPFDLADIKDSAGIDITNVTHIRIVDAGGCIQSAFATYDSQGHVVNDPWPTPFDTGGFDLDAIGVILNPTNLGEDDPAVSLKVYPNPVSDLMTVTSSAKDNVRLTFCDATGKALFEENIFLTSRIDLSFLPSGIYLAKFTFPQGNAVTRKIVKTTLAE